MTKPDFKEWADNIVLLAQTHGTAREEIENALKQAYEQGYSLGLNHGWAIEQDKDMECNDDWCDIQADLALQEYWNEEHWNEEHE